MANDNFIIATDADADIPLEWARRYGIEVLPMPYSMNGIEYLHSPYFSENSPVWFYEELRNGGRAATAVPSVADILMFFEQFLSKGEDILYIGISSKFSGLISTVDCVTSELLEKYPDRKIIVHDSLTVSAAQALLVRECAKLKEDGATIEHLENWLNHNTQRACFLLAFSDIAALKKGGRLTAGVNSGVLLGVNTLMYITQDGRIQPFERVKGRKRALRRLLEAVGGSADEVFVVYTDCLDDAEFMSKHFGRCDIGDISPVVGTHFGSDAVGIAFFSDTFRDVSDL